MTAVEYQYTRTPKGESLVVTGDFTRVIASSNPRFNDVRDYLFNTPDDELDGNRVLSLIDAGPQAINALQKLSERVSYLGGTLFFDGDEVDDSLSAHIVRMIENDDDDFGAFVAFLENLAQNPSKKSRKALFDFLTARNFTITEDGHFIGYKGVRSGKDYQNEDATKFYSLNFGAAYVNGEKVVGYIPNAVGDEITMPRSAIDPDRDAGCSVGLHVGTRDFAQSYSSQGAMLIVGVNPRDVVMVPREGDGKKMRVCRYTVLDTNESELTKTTYRGSHELDSDEHDEDEDDGVVICEKCGDEGHQDWDCACVYCGSEWHASENCDDDD